VTQQATTQENINKLIEFRQSIYENGILTRKDALFDLWEVRLFQLFARRLGPAQWHSGPFAQWPSALSPATPAKWKTWASPRTWRTFCLQSLWSVVRINCHCHMDHFPGTLYRGRLPLPWQKPQQHL